MKKIADLFVKIGADGSEFGRALTGLERSLSSTSKNLAAIGRNLTSSITLPLAGLAALAARSANGIDDAFDRIRSGTGSTGAELAGLQDSFRRVFAQVPSDAAAVATAIADLNTRTGATGGVLEGLSAQLLNLSRLTGTELATNIAAVTRLFGDWSIAVGQQSTTLDFLFRASQATGVSISTLAEKLVQFGAPLRQVGFSFRESAALLSRWEQQGVNAELVLGSLRIALGNFAKAGKDAPSALRAVIDEIARLGPGSAATAKAMETFGRRAGADMAAAITEGRFAIRDLVASLEGSTEGINTAAADTEGATERMRRAVNRLTVQLEPFGMKLLDAAARWIPIFSNALTSLFEAFGRLPAPIRAAAAAMAAMAAITGPLAIGLGAVANGLRAVAAAQAAAAAAQGATGVVGLLTRLAGFIGPGSAILVGLGGLAAAYFALKGGADAAAESVNRFNAALNTSSAVEIGITILDEEDRLKALRERRTQRIQSNLPTFDIDRQIAAAGLRIDWLKERARALQLPPTFTNSFSSLNNTLSETAGSLDKMFNSLVRVVQLGISTSAEEANLRNLMNAQRSIAHDVTRSAEERAAAYERARDAAEALLQLERKRIPQQDLDRLRLPSPGAVDGVNLPKASDLFDTSLKKQFNDAIADLGNNFDLVTEVLSRAGGRLGNALTGLAQTVFGIASGNALGIFSGAQALLDAIFGNREALDENTRELGKFHTNIQRILGRSAVPRGSQAGVGETLGKFDLLDIEFDIFNTPALERLKKSVDVFLEAVNLGDDVEAQIRSLNLGTEAGRTEFNKIMQDVFKRVMEGVNFGVPDEVILGWVRDITGLSDAAADAAKSINGLTGALRNAPEIFKIDLHRFNATLAMPALPSVYMPPPRVLPPVQAPSGSDTAPRGGYGAAAPVFVFEGPIVLPNVRNADEFLPQLAQAAERDAARGGAAVKKLARALPRG